MEKDTGKYKEQDAINFQKRKCFTKDEVLEQHQNKTLTKAHSGSQLIALSCKRIHSEPNHAHERDSIHTSNEEAKIQNQFNERITVYKNELQKRKQNHDQNYVKKPFNEKVKLFI
jgi:hypothetical protein